MIDIPSCSLLDYIGRTELPTRTPCDWFIAGVASYLAVQSWMQDYEDGLPPQTEILDVAALPSEEAVRAAYFFTGKLVALDKQFGYIGSLAVVLAAAYRRMWPDEDVGTWAEGNWAGELGWYVAAETAGEGVSWTDDGLPEHGLPYTHCPDADDSHYVKEKAGAAG